MKKKICIVTGSRAEYGLFYWLMREIQDDADLELQIIATGMHLSSEFGLTHKFIEQDGFYINRKVEILLSSDTSVGISKSMGLAMIGFAESYANLNPDIIVVLGDRFEIFCAASSACVARIPITHIHGGETTVGAIDEAFRHSITKMSHLHFTSTEVYKNRVIQLGESPERVFNVGALGVENINRIQLLSKTELEEQINFDLGESFFLVTFHPVTLENATAEKQFTFLLSALDQFVKEQDKNLDYKVIFTKANSDNDGRIINQMIDEYVTQNKDKTISFTSMGQLRYLSAMKYASAVIGNSSSGIIETPSFKVSTVNIGDRQKGRIKAKNIINCVPDKNIIVKSIKKAVSSDFLNSINKIESPYEQGKTASKIKNTIKEFNLNKILKKEFYDV